MNLITVKNQVKTIALLGGLSALLILLGGALAPGAIWVFVAIAVAMNLGSYFWSDKLVLAMSRARPLGPGEDPALARLVAELAAAAGVPAPRVYLIDEEAPNAFATGRNPAHSAIAVTTGIRQLLTERELRGVLAHEMSHVKNRDILIASIAAAVATAVSFIASALQWGVLLGGGADRRDDDRGGAGSAIGALALAIVAPIAATIIQLAISRQREYLADATGARLAGDPLALASALGKLERGNRRTPMHTSPSTSSLFITAPRMNAVGSGIASWFSTHPPIAERIRRLEEMATGVAIHGVLATGRMRDPIA